MKEIHVPYYHFKTEDLAEKSAIISKETPSVPVAEVNWPKAFAYAPDVSLWLAHDDHGIYLKFRVIEKTIRARESQVNKQVFKDSCVEFFFSPDGGDYYNFEFSCNGTGHAAYGPGRENRPYLDPADVAAIPVLTTLGRDPFEEMIPQGPWELTVMIPKKLIHVPLKRGTVIKGNFYKCGDELENPHFVTWNRIETPQPDFHRPEYFGTIILD